MWWFQWIILTFLVRNSQTHPDEVIVFDYFIYKKVPSVVGFTCGNKKSNKI